ncbi:uncharacterized protein LOC131696265 [Topomyia yanbarensis]|uniref:uncharacterized protein LOC131696265 n=1 Tax=Topomyia yanbarensis TaxID=2498891 RepID=UPI00273C99EA|nr:uncharacterized protein LOC131696265 [Topomyia yanbarensis]
MSAGECSQPPGGGGLARKKCYQTSPIWCLDFFDNFIEIGCADGRLEFWEGTTGNFKGIYEAENIHINGVTNIKFAGDKVIVARLSGRIDSLRLETYTQGCQIDWGLRLHMGEPTYAPVRQEALVYFSNSSTALPAQHNASEEELRCILEFHQQGYR